jgi:hypothetical protein
MVLAELAEVLREAGQEHHEMLWTMKLPATGHT